MKRSNELQDKFDITSDEADKNRIDNLFAELKAFADKQYCKVKDKNSDMYILLCIVHRIVFDIPGWSREKKFCEATFVRKFEEILDILFKNTKLFGKDGESSSQAAKSNQITNEDETQYERKLDVLLLSEQIDHEDIEICSNEFKKPAVSLATKCSQQSKNIRLNACIWNKLFTISKSPDLTVNYFDFIGRNGILAQLFIHKNNFVAHPLGQFVIIRSLVELALLHKSMLNLYKWKNSVKTTSHYISTAIAKQVNKYALADIFDVTESNPASSAPINLSNICLTPPRPTNTNKRKLD